MNPSRMTMPIGLAGNQACGFVSMLGMVGGRIQRPPCQTKRFSIERAREQASELAKLKGPGHRLVRCLSDVKVARCGIARQDVGDDQGAEPDRA